MDEPKVICNNCGHAGMDRQRADDWEFRVIYTCPKCGHKDEVKWSDKRKDKKP